MVEVDDCVLEGVVLPPLVLLLLLGVTFENLLVLGAVLTPALLTALYTSLLPFAAGTSLSRCMVGLRARRGFASNGFSAFFLQHVNDTKIMLNLNFVNSVNICSSYPFLRLVLLLLAFGVSYTLESCSVEVDEVLLAMPLSALDASVGCLVC